MKRALLLLVALLALSIPAFCQSEAQQVAAAEHDRNLQACKTGFGYCDHSLLTASEAPEIKVAEHGRNLQACKTGFGYCDHSLLTASEAPEIKAAEHDRNLQACKTGFGYCDHSLLTASEAPEIKVAEHDRNLQACKTGFGYCDHSLLNAGGESSNPAKGASSAPAVPSTAVTTDNHSSSTLEAPPCAENGSCYGDPNVNGVPKTVHVDGYYRKDGTYVRGYYRSAPGTNPPKAK